MIIPVILSGGSGTRLWPLSRRSAPKQFHALLGEHTLLQDTALRLASVDNVIDPIVVCGPSHSATVIEQLTAVGVSPTVVIEPSAKNTAPAVAAACLVALERDPEAIVVVLPSDHAITDTETFATTVAGALDTAAAGYLTTFGLVPTYPATGYGYIDPGERVNETASRIGAFVEKPDLDTATRYVQDGFLWNSGIFLLRAASFLEELTALEPDLLDAVKRSYDGAVRDQQTIALATGAWEEAPRISIDYAVMEPTERGAVVPLACGWSDVGSWAALSDLGDKDSDGNVLIGDVRTTQTTGSYVRAQSTPIVMIGVTDLIVVETPDALLIVSRDAAEQVGKVADTLPDNLR